MGAYHNARREYLHRYVWEFDFVWNYRQMNEGQRTFAAIQATEGAGG